MKQIVLATFCILCLVGCQDTKRSGSSNSGAKDASAKHENPDNTGINVRDREATASTPFDQNENKKDIDITANIRKRVVDTKMSTDAHNAKIITKDGHVTLRGPVKSEDEKKRIEEIAQEVAGAGHVDNQLEVADGR